MVTLHLTRKMWHWYDTRMYVVFQNSFWSKIISNIVVQCVMDLTLWNINILNNIPQKYHLRDFVIFWKKIVISHSIFLSKWHNIFLNLLVVMDVFFIKIVIYAATWDTFKPKPEKILKRAPKRNLIKISYTLTKTPFGETGCLSNHYYLVVAQASSFLIHPSFLNEKYILKIVLSRYLKKHIPAH